METSAPKFLSVCIPTYGQPTHIRQTLESLLGQDIDGIEIVIRDDNQDSETEKVVAEYLTRLPIRYFHMDMEGVDRAFLFLSKKARGTFVWWFGDDKFEPGAIAQVTKFLKRNPAVDFMYINSTDLSREHYSVKLGGSRFFVDRNEVLAKLSDQLGFCSAILFRKETLAHGFEKAEQCVGTCWVTFFLVLHGLTIGKSFYFFDGCNFLSETKTAGQTRWYDSFRVHGVNFALVARKFDDRFDRKVLQKMLADKFSRSWRAVIAERALGFETGFAAAHLNLGTLFRLYWNYPELYIALPMMLIPRKVLGMAFWTYRRLSSL